MVFARRQSEFFSGNVICFENCQVRKKNTDQPALLTMGTNGGMVRRSVEVVECGRSVSGVEFSDVGESVLYVRGMIT